MTRNGGHGPDRFLLGRSADCDVVLRHPQVSRHHAELSREGGRWVLRDLGSTQGTTRGGILVSHPTVLSHGDVIALGPVRIRLEDPAADHLTLLPSSRPLTGS